MMPAFLPSPMVLAITRACAGPGERIIIIPAVMYVSSVVVSNMIITAYVLSTTRKNVDVPLNFVHSEV
jgi:hypothetical protein